MSEFTPYRIDQLATTFSGATPSRDCKHFFGGSIPWVKSSEVNSNSIRDTEEKLTDTGFRSSSVRWVSAGTPLIAMYGATAGKVGWLNINAVTNQAVLAIAPKSDCPANAKWLYWSLLHSAASLLSRLQGSGQPNLSKSVIDAHVLGVPPETEQPVIAQILDTLDTAIRETEAIIAKLKAVKQGLLHDLLTRGIDANGELRPPQSEAPHLYKDSPLGWIPKEWDSPRLYEKLEVLGGKRLPAGHAYATLPTKYKYLRVTDFFERDYFIDELENLHEQTFLALRRYEIEPNQLYISIAGSIGHVGVHNMPEGSDIRTILTENAARLVPIEDMNPYFVAANMNSQMVQHQIDVEKGTGGGVPKLALFRIEQLFIAWPSKAEQDEIARRIQCHTERQKNEALMLSKLNKEKSGLMNDLLTGRVRVTPLLNGDTA